ncbi:hypothetical protein A6X21_22895 [Planctopirus hydrillae]|uniref:Uncharacterized protein n=2 Tax=Planctopirus hydrillae TaxID=1841610 RepID=A0A1C3ECR4_9PLAN|nr:hypothetical protein A6X21_22895 [Planctopirus hydrillae]
MAGLTMTHSPSHDASHSDREHSASELTDISSNVSGEGISGKAVDGRYVVVAMIVFGLSVAVAVALFWNYQTKPFRILTLALGREFPASLPKVEGGLPKKGPAILRIAIRVPFHPEEDNAAFETFRDKVLATCVKHQNLKPFQDIELHVFYFPPKHVVVRRSVTMPVSEVLEKFPQPDGPNNSQANSHSVEPGTADHPAAN